MEYGIIFLIMCLELIAALAGLYHIKKHKVGTYTKYLVYVLFFVFFTEVISIVFPLAVSGDIELFSSLQGTPFENNFWIHNIQLVVTFAFFSAYFRSRLKRGFLAKIIQLLISVFVVGAMLNFIFTDVYFTTISKFTYIAGSILILISILFYYFELLQSDNILRFSTSLTFYISVGSLLYYLCLTPLFIYSRYYYQVDSSKIFDNFYIIALAIANIIMYGIFTLGFLLCKPNQN